MGYNSGFKGLIHTIRLEGTFIMRRSS